MNMTRKDKQGILILIGTAVIFLLLFASAYGIKASSDKYDHETLCRKDGDYPTVKLLIDKTDPWSKQGRERLAGLIRRIKDGLAVNERLSIFVLDETGTYSPSPVFDMCNPGRGAQANILYENPRLIQKRFDEEFTTPLDNILDDLLRPGVASQSPILEAAVNLRGNEDNMKLIVVSDMIQNSDLLSFYGKRGHAFVNEEANKICTVDKRYDEIQVYLLDRPDIAVSARQDIRNQWHQYLGKISDKFRWERL